MSSTFLAEPLILIAFIVQRPARHKSGLANVPKGLPGSFMRATTANDVSEPSRPRRRPNERSASDASFEDDVPNYRLISQSRVTDAVQLTNTQSPKEWRKQLLIEIEIEIEILHPPPSAFVFRSNQNPILLGSDRGRLAVVTVEAKTKFSVGTFCCTWDDWLSARAL